MSVQKLWRIRTSLLLTLRHLRRSLFVILWAVVCLATSANATEPAGRMTWFTGQVDHRFGPEGLRQATERTPLMLTQHIRSLGGSQLTGRFRDGTRMRLGPASLVTLDDFIYAPVSGLAGQALTVHRGTFHFLPGVGAYDSQLSLLTPVATLVTEGGSVTGFHIPGAGTALMVTNGKARVQTSFGEFNLTSGQSAIVGPDGRGGLMAEEVPDALALEVVTFITQETGPLDLETPLLSTLEDEGYSSTRDTISQRGNLPQTPPITEADWPPNTAQAAVFQRASTQMPLFFEAQRKGLLDQITNAEARKADFEDDVNSQNPTSTPTLDRLTQTMTQQAETVQEAALQEVAQSLATQDLSAEDVSRFVASTSSADPEQALEISQAGMDMVGNPTAEEAQDIASQAARAAPDQVNELAAQAIANLPPDQQVEKAREIIRGMMANAPRDSTANRSRAAPESPGALEELPAEVQQAIADELKDQGFQEGGQNPDAGSPDTPSAQTQAAEPRTPPPGSTGGNLDIVAFLTSANFIIGLLVASAIIGIAFVFYRINAAQRRALEAKRKRELEIARRQRERQAALNAQVDEALKAPPSS